MPRRTALAAALLLLAGALTATVGAGQALAGPPQGGDGHKAPKLHYVVQDPAYFWATAVDPATGLSTNCFQRREAFTPTTYPKAGGGTATSTVLYGQQGGASYHVEYPASGWNGELVLWAHGYAGTKKYLCAGRPNIDRAWYLSHGYAWAASSYASNTYDVPQGVKDTHDLIGLFTGKVAKPAKVWLTGESMGGHITARAIEQYPHAFDGAMPTCGVLADDDLFDYFLDVNVVAAGLAGARAPFPTTDAAYTSFVKSTVMPVVGAPMPGYTVGPQYRPWSNAVVNESGGNRPGALPAVSFWSSFGFGDPPLNSIPFLYGVYPGTTAGRIGVANGNVTDNTHAVYRTTLDTSAPLTPAEVALNRQVTRVAADPGTRNRGLQGVPVVQGDPRVPVLTLHGLGDLFVPFQMEEEYAARVAAHGKSGLLVQRAVRNVNHCGFSQTELTHGFTDLVAWAKGGAKPAGDLVTDPAVRAKPSYGCRFTQSDGTLDATNHFTRSAVFFPPC